ncbi:non-specific lipid transfer protein GPI-anchored 14-like isoform X2 [Alnus glutinosa]|uniref:non-specific lipid transfer protein GPI-anchored 14-like isoform X2 n=1 Tax=Alnus glutinosa TaxID=3517 RepID=UPI002D768B8E|nr:non-specific lipid transfer protein GPI-anchored 14-like isoform X2 [Alnus glutinosa]
MCFFFQTKPQLMGLHLHHTTVRLGFILVLLISVMVSYTMADAAKDREECQQQLVSMATCLPYVGGEAKAPTPDCCSGLKQVLKNNKKCLCVIIRDRNDPDLGLQINVTLALSLPSVCHAPANVSQCPALLHMDPNSPEAQVFYQLGGSSNQSVGSPAPSPTSTVGVSPTSGQDSNGGYCSGKRWFGMEIATGGVLIWCFMISSHLFII